MFGRVKKRKRWRCEANAVNNCTSDQLIKRPFVLLEILISLTLMSIILSFLFSAMSRSAQFEVKIQSARTALLERQQLQIRLQDFFLSLGTEASFYTMRFSKEKQESLIALFNNGIDPEPAFSGLVRSRIFLDEEKNLTLALWPLEKEENKPLPWKTEVLLSHVDAFHFQMLGKKNEPNGIAVNDSFAWYDHWSKKRCEIPSMIRLSITQNGVALFFAFFSTASEPFITYREGEFLL